MQRVDQSARRAEPLGEQVNGVKGYRSIVLLSVAGITVLIGLNLSVFALRELAIPHPVVTYLLIVTTWLIVLAFTGLAAYAFSTLKHKTEVYVLKERLQNKADLIRSLEEQRHDFRNQLSVVLGMLNLGWSQHAVGFLQRVIDGQHAAEVHLKHEFEHDFYSFYGFLVHKSFVAANRNVLLRLDIGVSHLPAIPTDLLMRIAGNLIDNALDAAGAGEGGRVFVRAQAEDGEWTLTVWDNGPVIAQNLLARICDPGFTTKSDRGHGWGLSSVQRILSQYGATLEYYSTPEDGTSFVVRFALKRQLEPMALKRE